MVGVVHVEAAGDGDTCDTQRFPPRGDFDRLQVALVDRCAYERIDLRDDFGREGLFEPPLWAASFEAALAACSRVSQRRSLTSTRSRVSPPKRWYSAMSRRA